MKGQFTVSDAIAGYLSFLEQGMHVKSFVMRQNPQDDTSQSVAVRYQLDPPFGNHAASVERDDLQDIPDDKGDYIHSLIQLHHNFQVDKLVAAAAQHGEDIIADLYRLMTADQEGSRWAEYVVQKLEYGMEGPQSKFGFSEFAIEAISEPGEVSRDGKKVQGQVTLKAIRRRDLGERTLKVDYYVSDCDLSKFTSAKKKGTRKR